MASHTYKAYNALLFITAVLSQADGMRVKNSLSNLGDTTDKFPSMGNMGGFPNMEGFPNMGGRGNPGLNPMNPGMKPTDGMGLPNMGDMGGLIPRGDQMAACEKRQMEMCCAEGGFMSSTCSPLQFCMVATGKAKYPGPMICDPQFMQGMYGRSGQATCSKSDPTLQEELKQALTWCMQQLQPLYDLQKSLVECTTEVKAESSEIEQGSQAIATLSKEAEDCQVKVEEKKQEQQTASIKAGFAFCTAEQDALIAAMMKWQAEVHVCIASNMPKIKIEVEIPTVDIPVINASIDVPDIKVPDFTSDSFDSDIAIPGGGDKLNVAFDWKQSHGQMPKLMTLEERIGKVKADVAKCEETKTTIPAKKEKIQQATAQAAEKKTKLCAEAGSMLQLDVADQGGAADPSEAAQVQIGILEAFKVNPFMSCASAVDALDAFIAVLKRC